MSKSKKRPDISFHFLTIFPDMIEGYVNDSIIGRAQKAGLINIETVDIRNHTTDIHRKVDDKPYGGGPGMVMKLEPIYEAWKSVRKRRRTKTVLLAAKGKPFTQSMAKSWAKNNNQIIFIAGRYEGVDERVRSFVDEEVRVADIVLTGGELPGLMIMDAVSRHVPGVLGDPESLKEESFYKSDYLEYPHYTRPESLRVQLKGKRKYLTVPKVLLSGDHKAVEEWREQQSKKAN